MADLGAASATPENHSLAPELATDSLDDSIDLSYSDLCQFPHFIFESPHQIRSLQVCNNRIEVLSAEVGFFSNLVMLDISSNRLKTIADEICGMLHLRTFVARNNWLSVESIPKDFGSLPSLAVLNLSGNQLVQLPVQFTELTQLRCLYLGANQISAIPAEVHHMSKSVDFHYILSVPCANDCVG